MTKKAQMELCKTILHKYGVGAVITGEDFDFLISIFEKHDHWEEKQGVGVKSITTMKTGFGNRCFLVNRLDGTSIDISYMHSINGRNKQSDIKKACRNAIHPIISEMKRNINYGVDTCPISGDILTPNNTHIDHYDRTFAEIYSEWVAEYEEDYLFSKIVSTKGIDTITRFGDQELINSFVEFHNKNTHLRAVTAEANLSLIKKIGK